MVKTKLRLWVVAAALVLAAVTFGPKILNQPSTTSTYRLHASYEGAPRGVQVVYIVSGARPVPVDIYDPKRKITGGDWEQDVIYRMGTGGIILSVTADARDLDAVSTCSITRVRAGIEVMVVARGDGTNDAPASCSFDAHIR